MHQEKAIYIHSKKVAISKPIGEVSPGTKYGITLILDFPTSRNVRNDFLFLKPCSPWYCAKGAQVYNKT